MFFRYMSSLWRKRALPSLLLLTVLASLALPPGISQAASVNVIDINSNAMSLSGGTLISGTAGALNAVYSYSNVITVGSVTVSAKITITESNGATLDKMDDEATFPSRLNPVVTTASGTGSATLKVEFFNQSTGDPVALKNFFVTVIDIDGSSSTKKEFVELSGFASYTTNNPTGLTIGAGSNGRTQFEGISSSLNGITFEDSASFIANYTAPISVMNVVVGNKGVLSGRQFSINFGAIAVTDHFTNPQTVSNANAPTLTVAINDGGDGKVESSSEIAATPIGGTTNAGTGQTVLLEVSDGAGHTGSYSAVVAGDGSYTVDANLTGFNYGTITVKADVVNSQGNPAPTATDTTLKSNLAPTATGGSKSTDEDTPVNGTLTGSDGNGDNITYAIDTMPAHGTAVITDMTTGAYTYTPDADYHGSDSFTFKVSDGLLTSSAATINITVLSVNDPPTANGSSKSTPENTALSDSVSGTDADGDTLTYMAGTLPTHGTLTLNTDGTYTYTPAAGYYGSDSFTFTASDGNATSSPATVSITVTHVNHAPTTADSSETTAEDTPVNGTATANDSDGDTLTYTVVMQPQHGAVVFGSGASFTYTPDANYNGPDSFTFKVNDGTVDSNTSTVSLTVTAVNDAPTVNDSSKTTAEDTPLDASVSGSDVEGSALTYAVVTQPLHGTVTMNADGTYTYTPNANYNGPDSFTFKANDGSLDSAAGTVTLTVTPVNDPPTTGDSSETTAEDTPVNGSVTAGDVDNDTLTYTVVTQPQHGTVTLNADGTYTYTPDANYNGPDSFTFKVNDGTVDSNTSTVSLTVTADNDAPTVNDSSQTTAEDTPLDASVSGSDVEGSTLTYAVVMQPQHGTVTMNADGTYTYTPNANYNGPDSFTFKANDGSLDSAAGTVTLTVTPVNDPPAADPAAVSLEANTPKQGTLTGQDADGDSLTFTAVTQPAHGTLVLNPNGTYTYTPDPDFGGSDSFTFKVNDGSVDSPPVTVTLTVNLLEGWAGSRDVSVTTPEWVVAPDKPLKLSALTSISATEVKAVMDFDGPDADSTNDEIGLTLVNPGTYLTDGYKKWENVVYRLPAQVAEGSHAATFVASDANGPLSAEPAGKLLNNRYTVVKYIDLDGVIADRDTQQPVAGAQVTLYDPTGKQVVGGPVITDAGGHYSFPHVRTEQYLLVVKKDTYASRSRALDALPGDAANTVIHQDFELVRYILTLSANPSSLVGDGVTTSMLTAILTDMDGHPLAGVPITFTAPLGTFVGSAVATTDANGKATIQYKSAKIEGILSQQIPVTATAEDNARAIYAQEQIIVTFEPASVSGIVASTTNGVRTVLPGTKVKVTKDFDNDGIIDFAAEAVTDVNGAYSLAVPRGDVQYDVEVIKTVTVGNQTKEIAFKQTADVGAVTGTGGEVFDSTKTATGVLITQLPGGDKKLMDENSPDDQQFAAQVRIKLRDPVTKNFVTVGGQTSFPLSADGVFNIPGLGLNQEYELAIVYTIPDAANHGPDKEIIVNSLDNAGSLPKIKVAANGEMNILDELIDPYGDITDFNTHTAIDGAFVKLYYANTARNIGNGVVPNTEVVLPLIPGFAPNDNANPQTSRDGGKYAYMVYPTTDYYLKVSAPGYDTYTSPVIPVEFAIVRHDVVMKKSGGGGGGPIGPIDPIVPAAPVDGKPNVTVNVSIERSKQAESTTGIVKVAYLNNGTAGATGATVKLTIPAGAVVVDADGGQVEGNTITWQAGDLAVMKGGEFKVTLRYPAIDQAEVPATLAATGQSADDQGLLDAALAQASAKMMLFSNRFGELSHTRYILGYPDALFHPMNNLTRAELAAIVARLQTGGATTLKAQFSDVPQTHWASGYIRIATDSGLFDGFNDGTFRPDTPVTREELAVVMTRFLKLDVSTPIKPHFYDAQGRWSTAAIEALYRSGLVSGYEDGSFKPGSAITRLEAVTMINSLLFRGPLTNVQPSFPDVDATNWAFGQVEEATRSHQATRDENGAERFTQALDDQVE